MPSYKEAVYAKCHECIFDETSPGTWREQVRDCTSYACPLFHLRPQPIRLVREAARRRNLGANFAFDSVTNPPLGGRLNSVI
jgi:hypothetical protein